MTIPVDFTDVFEAPPTESELKNAAEEYLRVNVMNTRNMVNYSVNMISVATQYPELYDVKLCDTVTIEDEVLNIRAKRKVCKTVWDCISEKYTTIEIGDLRQKLRFTIKYANARDIANSKVKSVVSKGSSPSYTRLMSSLHNITPAKLATNNATKISALEKKLAKLNSNSGAFDGKIGGENNQYGQIVQYDRYDEENAIVDKDGVHGEVVISPIEFELQTTQQELLRVTSSTNPQDVANSENELIYASVAKDFDRTGTR